MISIILLLTNVTFVAKKTLFIGNNLREILLCIVFNVLLSSFRRNSGVIVASRSVTVTLVLIPTDSTTWPTCWEGQAPGSKPKLSLEKSHLPNRRVRAIKRPVILLDIRKNCVVSVTKSAEIRRLLPCHFLDMRLLIIIMSVSLSPLQVTLQVRKMHYVTKIS